MNQSEADTFVNPFSTKFWTPGIIPYQFYEKENEKEWDINILIEQKIKYGSIMQVVGSHGSGKSTLLRTLLRHLEQHDFVIRLEVLNDRRHKLLPDFLPIRHDKKMFYMIDGYEQLPFWERIRLRFQNWSLTGGLLLTAHKPVLGIRILHQTTPRFELFVKLVQELTKTYSATYSHNFGTTELREIYQRAGGNFRTAFFELYDLVQMVREKSPIHNNNSRDTPITGRKIYLS
jgi:ABC-type dipeptide/oligopeptide/nickel transport system ATPase component